MSKEKVFECGQKVKYTAKFLQSVGGAVGWPKKGVVVGHSEENLNWIRVQWKGYSEDDSNLVNACNIMHDGKPDYTGM